MGGPIDATKSPTAVNNLAMQRSIDWFENNVIYRVPPNFPGAGRRVYPGFMQHTGFVAMNPDRHATSHYDYFQDLVKGDNESAESHRQFYDEYTAVLDMDANYYLQTIETVFQEFKLVRGTWDVTNEKGKVERVQPQAITSTGLLTVEGELDDISGSGQTAAAHDLCTSIPKSNRTHFEVEGAGHYGIFSGRRWRDMVYPVVRQFIAEHQSGQSASKTQAAVLATYTHKHAVPAGLAQADASTPAAPAAERVAAPAAPVAKAAKVAKAPVAKPKKTVAARVAPAPIAQAAAPAKAKSKTVAPSKTAASKAPAASTPAAAPSRRKAR
jgi:poly(3-hydroxybutyrate) depolymerase